MLRRLGLLVASYLFGAFPTASLVGQTLGRDVYAEGSGNPGATNIFRVAGARAGAVVAATDVLKGVLPAVVGAKTTGSTAVGAACGAAAVVGHCFPLSAPGRGGKGVATAAGMVLAVDPALALGAAPVWASIAKLTRRPSIASITVAAGIPLVAVARRRPAWEVVVFTVVGGIVLARHEDNIRRLVRGEEDALA
ncbi:MAG TPA: glycerol-3-phosphate 1-O-acyltransferase PlsY [Acidimicrobiales bacterium]|nr:glycerol-3-phosphate 1-O-acyltransferase PlsY [Acidimicrobiales bacterium]